MVSKVCVMERQQQTVGGASDEGTLSTKLCVVGTKVVIMGQAG